MRLRTAFRLAGATLVVLGLVLAGRFSTHLTAGGQPAASGQPVPSSTIPNRTAQSGPVPSSTVPSSTAPTSDARLSATVQPNGDTGGVVVIPIPPAAPERCSPAHIAVVVGQTTVAACTAVHYGGPIDARVANPAIASVRTSGGLMVPRYLYVVGLKAGTTIVRVSYPHGPTTLYTITVHPAGTSGQ
jgi:hypothetical protein